MLIACVSIAARSERLFPIKMDFIETLWSGKEYGLDNTANLCVFVVGIMVESGFHRDYSLKSEHVA